MSYPIPRISPITAGRERSPDMWRQLLENYEPTRLLGALRADDFHTPHTHGAVATASNGWFLSEGGLTGATAEAFATNDSPDGVAIVSATTSASHMGVKVQAGESATQGENVVLPTHTSAPKSDVVFEARVDLDLTKNPTCFIGLAEAGVVLLGDSTLTLAADYIGFYRINSGDLQIVVRNDNDGGTAVEYSANVIAAADITAGFHKLGIRVNTKGSASHRIVEVFYDGVKYLQSSDATPVAIRVPETALPEEVLTRTLIGLRGVTAANATTSVPCDFCDAYVSE